jgi:Abi-like protein
LQAPFGYDVHIIAALRSSVSAERLQRYQAAAAGDAAQALRLYMWNTALSEGLYGPVQGLEITLRNKMHERFAAQFGSHWYDASAMGLQYAQQDQVTRAKQSLRAQSKPLDPPRVVAELSFGFWAGLFGRRYENHLWRPHLRHLFVNAPSPFLRRDAHQVLNDVRLLRNRIAHHEPILHRPLPQEYGLVLTAIGWLCSSTAAWVDHHSRFNDIYTARP